MFEKRKIGGLHTSQSINTPEERIKIFSELKNRLRFRKNKLYILFISILIVISLLFSMSFFFTSFKFSLKRIGEGIVNSIANIKKDENGFINILLIGIGGEGHDGGNLTDTMIVASVDLKNNNIVMLSIPRDVFVDYNPNYHGSRINEIYRDMYSRFKNLGIKDINAKDEARLLLVKEISKITNLNIPYYAQIDFKGFEKLIDVLGGLNIYVEESLLDTQYPDKNWGYETFKIDKGNHILDGKTALKYARSRHSSSDFSRAGRQQKIITAIKDKVLNFDVLGNASKIKEIYGVINEYCNTNFSFSEMLSLGYKLKDYPKENIYNVVLNDDYNTKGGFLGTPPRQNYGGAFVLVPYPDERDFSRIRMFSDIIFKHRNFNNIKIEVLNSSSQSGMAGRVGKILIRYGINIAGMRNNIEKKDISEMHIYTSKVDIEAFRKYWYKLFPLTQIKIVDKIGYYEETDVDVEIIIGNNIKI